MALYYGEVMIAGNDAGGGLPTGYSTAAQLSIHDEDVKGLVDMLSADLSTRIDELEENLKRTMGAAACLDYDQAISWQINQSISCEALPWDARIIILSADYMMNPVFNDIIIDKNMIVNNCLDVRRDTEILLSSAKTFTDTQGYLIPYSYGNASEDDMSPYVTFSAEDIINNNIPSELTNILDSYYCRVYMNRDSAIAATCCVSDLSDADTSTRCYNFIVQLKTKNDITLKTWSSLGPSYYLYSKFNYNITSDQPFDQKVNKITKSYVAPKNQGYAKNVVCKNDEFCYFRYQLSSQVRALSALNIQFACKPSTIAIW